MKTDIEWESWGRVDPLFGVAAWEGKSKTGNVPWTDEEFYALGESDWRDFKRHWDHFGVTYGACLEIGCGAGRMTRQLAKDFHSVTALDVSEWMLAYARERVRNPEVTFLLSKGPKLPQDDGSIDAVFSTHVFQHFDAIDDASAYFREIARVLRRDGSLLIHLPLYRWPGYRRIFGVLFRLPRAAGALRAAWERMLIARGIWRPLMRHLPYDIDWVVTTLDDLGFTGVEIRIIRVRSNQGEHPFVMARKGP